MPTFDFQDGKGPVAVHQHLHGGGLVADTAFISATAYIGFTKIDCSNNCGA